MSTANSETAYDMDDIASVFGDRNLLSVVLRISPTFMQNKVNIFRSKVILIRC